MRVGFRGGGYRIRVTVEVSNSFIVVGWAPAEENGQIVLCIMVNDR